MKFSQPRPDPSPKSTPRIAKLPPELIQTAQRTVEHLQPGDSMTVYYTNLKVDLNHDLYIYSKASYEDPTTKCAITVARDPDGSWFVDLRPLRQLGETNRFLFKPEDVKAWGGTPIFIPISRVEW